MMLIMIMMMAEMILLDHCIKLIEIIIKTIAIN